MRFRFSAKYLLAIPILIVVALLVYNLPFVHSRLAWRVDNLVARIQYAIDPPQKVVFLPQEQAQIDQIVQATLAAVMPSATPSPTSTLEPTPTQPGPTPIPTLTATTTPEPTAIPAVVQLTGITHEYQKWNNCGPANLSMALSFWDWKGDQLDVAGVVKPNSRDKNVMPYELADFVNGNTPLRAVVRVGGSLGASQTVDRSWFSGDCREGLRGRWIRWLDGAL